MATSPEINPQDALRTAEERAVGVSLPIPISRRLDQLVDLVEGAGLRIYRKDIVAALILDATEDPQELSKLVLRLRTAKARDAQVEGSSAGTVLQLARQKPGRRRRG
jgi:hypothetical protein